MSFMSKMVEILENQAKSKTLVYLRTVSEQQQIDYGFSPALIKQGVKAWPWKTLPENADLPQIDKLTNLLKLAVIPSRNQFQQRKGQRSTRTLHNLS